MRQYETLPFSHNWNGKLFCECFTTFRLNSKKYYVGNEFRVLLNKTQDFGIYEVIEKKEIKLSQVNEWIARIDTGYGLQQFREIVTKMYSNTVNVDNANFCLLLLKKKP